MCPSRPGSGLSSAGPRQPPAARTQGERERGQGSANAWILRVALSLGGEPFDCAQGRRRVYGADLARAAYFPDMLLHRLYDDSLAQAAYLIGCQATGEAI